MTMETTLAVANYFIKKSMADGIPLTPMKLLKLVYIAHGWHLGIKGEPLINESVQAWKYGPVIKSIYDEFKKFGNSPISETAYELSDKGQVIIPMVSPDKEPFLDKIWDVYKNFDGLQLSSLTHKTGTPWDQIWNQDSNKRKFGVIIPNNLIEEHYKLKAENQPATVE